MCVNTSVCVGRGAGLKVREQLSGTGCLFGLKSGQACGKCFSPQSLLSVYEIFFFKFLLMFMYVSPCGSLLDPPRVIVTGGCGLPSMGTEN